MLTSLHVTHFIPAVIFPPLTFTHSGLDCFQQQDGLFVLAGSLSVFSLFDHSIALHVENWDHLQLLIFFHHPRVPFVGHGVSHLEAAGAKQNKDYNRIKAPLMEAQVNVYEE